MRWKPEVFRVKSGCTFGKGQGALWARVGIQLTFMCHQDAFYVSNITNQSPKILVQNHVLTYHVADWNIMLVTDWHVTNILKLSLFYLPHDLKSIATRSRHFNIRTWLWRQFVNQSWHNGTANVLEMNMKSFKMNHVCLRPSIELNKNQYLFKSE